MHSLKVPRETCMEIDGRWKEGVCLVKGTPHPELEKAITEKGYDWVLGAMMEESLGYYVPSTARLAIRDYFKGEEKCYSERCVALYGRDLEKMLLDDIRKFKQEDPKRAERIVESVKKLREIPTERQMEISLMYPTMRI